MEDCPPGASQSVQSALQPSFSPGTWDAVLAAASKTQSLDSIWKDLPPPTLDTRLRRLEFSSTSALLTLPCGIPVADGLAPARPVLAAS